MLATREEKKAWSGVLRFPLQGRQAKPRHNGLTMIIDKGLGLKECSDLLDMAGDYIDFIKLGFGTSALYNRNLLVDKVNLIKSHGVDVYPGGTFLEVAIMQGKEEDYLITAKDLGFTAIEVSDGTIPVANEVRARIIDRAGAMGLKVLTEVGKKDPRDETEMSSQIQQIKDDLSFGAYKVIIEGRESGQGIGIYDATGKLKIDKFHQILDAGILPDALVWEAPLKAQQQDFILRFGPNVNLGNVQPGEILALEALRVGLRGDTLRAAFHKLI